MISTVSAAEILTGFYAAGYPEMAVKARELLRDLTLSAFEIVPVTFEIADLAASLKAERGGSLPDALIAASAIDRRADLIYSENEDLKRFNEDIKVSKLE